MTALLRHGRASVVYRIEISNTYHDVCYHRSALGKVQDKEIARVDCSGLSCSVSFSSPLFILIRPLACVWRY